MEIVHLRLNGLKKIIPRVFHDERGFFYESYREIPYKQNGIEVSFVQDNVSFSKFGTVRALHFQSGQGQAKLVSCVTGKIWDVAVDIRKGSPTFGQWEAVELSGENHEQLFVPVGFAHGFCVLSETALVQYKVSAPYDPKTECSIRWDDPEFNIDWPVKEPLLSPRDKVSPFFREVYETLDSRR